MGKIESGSSHRESSRLPFLVQETIVILLLVLSLIGVNLTEFSTADGWWYWMIMIVVFTLSAIVVGLFTLKKRSQTIRSVMQVQLIHWASVTLIVIAAFSLLNADVMEDQAASLVVLLILSLASFLDGVHIGWRFSMVGVFLGVTAVIMAHIEDYLIFIAPLALLIVIVTFFFGK